MISIKNNQLLIEGKWWDLLYAYQFLRRLVMPFDKTDAFKLGIIDKNGINLIPRKDFTTDEQKNAYTYFDVMIFNLKKLLGKIPGGKTQLASFVASLLLLREEKNRTFQFMQTNNFSLLETAYSKLYSEIFESRRQYSQIINEMNMMLNEEMATADLPTLQIPTSTVSALRKKQKKDAEASMLRRTPLPEEVEEEDPRIEKHGQIWIFHVDPKTFQTAKAGKGRYERYSRYVGEADLGEDIRSYAVSNPKLPVILKCDKTGQLAFLKYGSKAIESINRYQTYKREEGTPK